MNSMKYESPEVRMDVFDLAKLYKGSKSEALEMNESLKDGFREGEILEVIEASDVIEAAATGILAASVSFAIYKALKELLSLEGARRRGEITNGDVIERVSKIAWTAGKKGVVIGAITGIIVIIFGSSILIPLTVISPFITVQMVAKLWQAFWEGLDDAQKLELKSVADQLGGKIKDFFVNLDRTTRLNEAVRTKCLNFGKRLPVGYPR